MKARLSHRTKRTVRAQARRDERGVALVMVTGALVVLMVMLYVPLYFITTKTRKPKETRIEEL